MNVSASHAMLILSAEQSLRVEGGARMRITCLSGLLWVTQEGDRRDLFPAPGDSLELQGDGVILVTALEPSVVSAGAAHADLWHAGLLARLLRAVRETGSTLTSLSRCS